MQTRAVFLCLLLSASARADSELDAVPVVISSPDGVCYARSIPSGFSGGVTTVYDVGNKTDAIRDSYDWYSRELYPWCWIHDEGQERKIGLVRMGNWASGHEASASDIALSFFVGGKLVREYSALEIAGRPDNVNGSISHYIVFKKIAGFVDFSRHPTPFKVVTTDGRTLEFDPRTGEELTGLLRGDR